MPANIKRLAYFESFMDPVALSILGILFTKCPTCYQSHWIYCVQEPDVKRQRDRWGHYYSRDLADGEREN